MRATLPVALALALATAMPAMAQNASSSPTAPSATPSTSSSSSTSNTPLTPNAMQSDVKRDLEQAGFTDVQVMASSFTVRAKDKAGRPVMMVINPDSVTEITGMAKPPASK